VFKLWEALESYFKDKPYWATIRPAFGLFSIYLVALVTVYQYVQWQYRISPPLSLFFRSYLFRQVSIGFAAFALLLFVFRSRASPEEPERMPARWLRLWRAAGVKRVAVATVIVSLALIAFVRLAPVQARHVRVRFLSEPGAAFDRYAFVYLLYELNKQQRHWYFDVDFDTFDPAELTSSEREACGDAPMCYARRLGGPDPFIGVTTEPLGSDSFWQNDGTTSVVTTHRWPEYAPPSTYEFLAHVIIVQSIVIHLNAHCRGLPSGAYRTAREARGDLFQFAPRRQAMKAEIMASHLSPQGEELLLNCFGVDYMTTCSNLLTLDWMRSKRVEGNLKRAFGVSLDETPAQP
jgi:hypothetical protein